jgi:NAD-dependent SIR2 family protein deacetylase
MKSTESYSDRINKFRELMKNTDAVIIGAGAGLSTAAGFIYTGERFQDYFWDFAEKYGFRDMYSGGFYPYKTPEEHWAYWSRYIYVNRYMDPPKPLYEELFDLVKDKDYFVLTTNVDHCFQKAGFDKHRLFYTQGDYGLFQCSEPCHDMNYDNYEMVRAMVESQGYVIGENGNLALPEGVTPKMSIPTELLPTCPVCGKPMTMNLRSDDKFVEDGGWHVAAERYSMFLRRHENMPIVFLELGVGYNTPGIIRYPFERLTYQNPDARLVRFNKDFPDGMLENVDKTISFTEDISAALMEIKALK